MDAQEWQRIRRAVVGSLASEIKRDESTRRLIERLFANPQINFISSPSIPASDGSLDSFWYWEQFDVLLIADEWVNLARSQFEQVGVKLVEVDTEWWLAMSNKLTSTLASFKGTITKP